MSGRGFQPPVQDLLSSSCPSPLAYLTLRVLLRTCSHNSACRVLRAAELEHKPGAPGEPSVSFGAESLGQALPSSGEGPPVLSPLPWVRDFFHWQLHLPALHQVIPAGPLPPPS